MVSTFSPHCDGGGTLLHSPTHLSHIDPSSAIKEIRRSLSRSPSRGSEYRRQFSFRSQSPSISSATFSPSPLSPSRRSTSDNLLTPGHYTSPHAVPFPPSARAYRPGLRRSAQTQVVPRTRTSPKSPSKRALTDLSDGGNSSPMPVRKRSSTEAERDASTEIVHILDDKENEHATENEWTSKHGPLKAEKRRSAGFASAPLPLSPMKRADGAMNLEPADFGSPSAKRRSLHGPSHGLDFNIFESDFLVNENDGEKRSQDDSDCLRHGSSIPSSPFSTIPKRSSSLRKSTLQQRQPERPSIFKGRHSVELMMSSNASSNSITNLKKGQRMSLDNHVPPMPRNSPFSCQGTLLNASIHPLPSQQNGQPQHYPHPLSRTMTQSSSTSSMADESPTHEPIHRTDRPRSVHDFSKSLPIGASRPTESIYTSSGHSQAGSHGSFATPANYKSAKPLPAAFMSTGLISKKNRNVEEPDGGLPKAHMPDTPCKKQNVVFPQLPTCGAAKIAPPISAVRHSFGTPSTPVGPQHSAVKAAPFPFAKGSTIFGNAVKRSATTRKQSIVSNDSDERSQSQSPTAQVEGQSTADPDFPPTPTKRNYGEELGRSRGLSSLINETSGPLCAPRLNSVGSNRFSSKLSPIGASPGSVDGDSDSVMEDSPSASLRLKSSLTTISVPSSFTKGRLLKNLNSPTPLPRNALTVPPFHSPRFGRTKLGCLSPVSPHHGQERNSPHTPHENVLPPDPSGLSISVHCDRPLYRPGSSSAPQLPATPTGPRDYFPTFSSRPSLNLTTAEAIDVDQCLASRFDRFELIGSGEFSQVYRVAQPPDTPPYHSLFSISATRSSSRNSLPERVWAVKKSRHPYSGPKDRQRKIHEVDVLKALGHSDHILSFVDSWEDHGHLYIQTEFCEEGTLDVFLAQVGLKARLDDFRIWKILLELSLVSPCIYL